MLERASTSGGSKLEITKRVPLLETHGSIPIYLVFCFKCLIFFPELFAFLMGVLLFVTVWQQLIQKKDSCAR